MKILSPDNIAIADQFTIEHEPIPSIELMERAAMACVRRLTKILDSEIKVYVACGQGNNGGDGLAIARLLQERGYDVTALVILAKEEFSPDALQNYLLLKEKFPSRVIDIKTIEVLKEMQFAQPSVLIDALLGTGVKGEVEGFLGESISVFNFLFKYIISIDVPSGLMPNEHSSENKNIIHSTHTITLQLPKLAFLLQENERFVPEFEIVDIGLKKEGIDKLLTQEHYITKELIAQLLKKRKKHDHKGTFGHALLLAGSSDKPGAALISAEACLRSGAGLLTVHSVQNVLNALSVRSPEAMQTADEGVKCISSLEKTDHFNAIAFGPGTGTSEETQTVLKKLLQYYKGKLVIDADGLNILSENKTWLSFLPPDTILTPHPKEFERLAGKSENDFERLQLLRQFSQKNNVIVILKGGHSAIAMPDGNIYFNSSGNAGLAKGGSGDALTGMILGLLTRGYTPPQASLIATFVHGLAADLCIKKMSMESVLISDVIARIPRAFKKLED